MYGILNEDYSVTPTDIAFDAYQTNTHLHRIKRDFVGDYAVSSVFLPMDHGYTSTGVHFECYVFPAKNGEITSWSEVAGERAHSYDALMKIHEKYVRQILDNEMSE